jgi:uncharacterized membrane protein YozB (DUF420 family)
MLKSFFIFVLFLGTFLIMHGIYEQKIKNMKQLVRTEYKFVPRTLYDEVLATTDIQAIYKNFFDSPDPWYNRNVGVKI